MQYEFSSYTFSQKPDALRALLKPAHADSVRQPPPVAAEAGDGPAALHPDMLRVADTRRQVDTRELKRARARRRQRPRDVPLKMGDSRHTFFRLIIVLL